MTSEQRQYLLLFAAHAGPDAEAAIRGVIGDLDALAARNARLVAACQEAMDALASCYDVVEWPANGKRPQDKALAACQEAIGKGQT